MRVIRAQISIFLKFKMAAAAMNWGTRRSLLCDNTF